MSRLLLTKLNRPSIPPKRVRRTRLHRRLNDGMAAGRQVTLVSAPAGFGKTLCIAEWVDTLALPTVWLSLDAADDEPGQFFTYLIAALQTLDDNLGWEIDGVLRSGQVPPAAIISTTLINDILELDAPFVLVLDDCHLVQDRVILQVLEMLLNNLPPPLHLVLLTREDPALPLARLRAGNQLTEIRASDLRFTQQEALHFLNEVMSLALPPAAVGALAEKTEGWVVGLQLAAIAMQSAPDPAVVPTLIETLSGSHRHILGYLTQEVLNRQPDDIQQFLLQTSILERLNGDLCNAVTGRTDSHQLLEQLLAANLFLIPLDDEQRWYRYHHLFADLLRDRQNVVPGAETTDLHRRASRWYEQAAMSREAIHHALAAQDYGTAVRLIESHALDMLMQWHVKTVDGWMQMLPPEWSAQSPRTNLAFAWKHILYGDHAQALPYLERLQVIFGGDEADDIDSNLRAEWLALQSTLLNAQGKAEEGLALANRALAIAQDQDRYVKSLIYLGVVNAYQQMQDYDRAVEAFQFIIQHGRAANNLVAEMLGASGLALMALEQGRLHFAYRVAAEAVERIERSGSLPPITSALYGELGVVTYQWHQLEQAHSHFLRSVQVSVLSGFGDAEAYHNVVLSRLHLVRGNLTAAAQAIEQANKLMQRVAQVTVREEIVAQHVRICLAQGRLPAAEQALHQYGFSFQGRLSIPGFSTEQNRTYHQNVLYNSVLRILLHRARSSCNDESLRQTSLTQGIELADQMIDWVFRHRFMASILETLLLRAQLHDELGDALASIADYRQVLELAEPEGCISIFVEEGAPAAQALNAMLDRGLLGRVQPDFVRTILAAFPRPDQPEQPSRPVAPSGESPALIDPLTERELEVLHLMADGLTYQQIADDLVISLNTVRFYVKAIYSKLNVNKRVRAITLARTHHLI